MGSNPKDSDWYSTPQEKRNRKNRGFTLDDKVYDALSARAAKEGRAKSVLVEEAILEYLARHKK